MIVIISDPAVLRLMAGIVAVSSVAETNVVVSREPFNSA